MFHDGGMGKNPPSSIFYRTRLGQAAAANMLIVARCNLCRRSRIYVAADLVPLYGPDTFVFEMFQGRCPRCGSGDFWSVHERYACDADVGMLTVRRPAGVRTIQLWKDELYSAPAKK
jgi:hypothetical protein